MAEVIKRKLAFGIGALGIIGIVFALTMGLSFGKFSSSDKDVRLGLPNPPISQVPAAAEELSNAFVSVSNAVTPAVVQIQVTATPKAVNVPNNQNQSNDMFKFFLDRTSLFIISICRTRNPPPNIPLDPGSS